MHISGLRYYSPETGRWVSRDPLGREGSLNLYGFVSNLSISLFDPIGLAVWTLPKDPVKCANIKGIIDFWAVGWNDNLWNFWLSGAGGTHTTAFKVFDPLGSERKKAKKEAVSKGLDLAAGLECGGTGYTSHNLPKPKKTNRYSTLISPMVYGWRFWFECEVHYAKKCGGWHLCPCRTHAGAYCTFHALDQIHFWTGKNKSFNPPGHEISDDLVAACFPHGKAFNLKSTAKANKYGWRCLLK
jgi:hypothetical protein